MKYPLLSLLLLSLTQVSLYGMASPKNALTNSSDQIIMRAQEIIGRGKIIRDQEVIVDKDEVTLETLTEIKINTKRLSQEEIAAIDLVRALIANKLKTKNNENAKVAQSLESMYLERADVLPANRSQHNLKLLVAQAQA